MNKKDIKAHVRKQIKQHHPNWNKLNKSQKKQVVQTTLEQVKQQVESGEVIPVSIEEKLTIEPIPEDVMTIEKMEALIDGMQKSRLNLIDLNREKYLDPEKRAISTLLDDDVLNYLLAHPGDVPCKQIKKPAMLFRAELLKALDYAEMSYRKFCRLEINDMERKKNRCFIGLSLRQKQIINHSELSTFRSTLTYAQQLNLLVYIFTQLKSQGYFPGKVFYGVDGTDLAAKLKSHPIGSIEVDISGKKEKISVYNQLDVDCGERRTKSDKSKYFVGYKIHTLNVIHAETGMAFPLISLVSAANHHDSNFLSPLVLLGKALGLDIELVIADQAYDGTDVDFMDINGVRIVSQSHTRTKPPENVDTTGNVTQVYLSDECENPMEYIGREGSVHEFRCGASPNECPYSPICPRHRQIPVDNGLFGAIPKVFSEVSKLEESRKVIERPFNLLKNRNGTDRITVKSQHSVQVVVTISTLAVLLIEIAGFRKERKSESHQPDLPFTMAA